ncbi:hypothetical protein PGN35_000915 [Nodosilinea sp. PGN35]
MPTITIRKLDGAVIKVQYLLNGSVCGGGCPLAACAKAGSIIKRIS